MKPSTLKRIYEGKSRAGAVRLFCAECMGYDGHRIEGAGNVSFLSARLEVKNCEAKECPLWPYRLRAVTATKPPETTHVRSIPSAQFSTNKENVNNVSDQRKGREVRRKFQR